LDIIRAELYEETKNMTNADAARFVNEIARPIAAKYGIKAIMPREGGKYVNPVYGGVAGTPDTEPF